MCVARQRFAIAERIVKRGPSVNNGTIEPVSEIVETLFGRRRRLEAEIARIDDAIAILLGAGDYQGSVRQDFKGLGITAGAKRLLAEAGRPLSTREILDGIKARGVVTRSKKESATVYATLNNSKDIRRIGDKWELVTKPTTH